LYLGESASVIIVKRWIRISTGLGLLVIGLAGWALPFLPGWLFVIPGLILLSKDFLWASRVLSWLRSKFSHKVAEYESEK
jgi:uncharacterized membrane protein YbaN (DUF454 family)